MSDRKIKMLINLSNTNIIKIYQILKDENFLYIVTVLIKTLLHIFIIVKIKLQNL